ncbi:MAG: hypothetical protein JWP87_2907, partial [Labilithrix sp.]|nr:hypothetical protein [Labilithrix sp.]
MGRLNRRVVGASAAALGAVAFVAIGILALRSASPDTSALRNAAMAQPAQRSVSAAVPAEIPPPDLDVKPAVVAPVAQTPTPVAAAPATGIAIARVEMPAGGKATTSKYGRLTITGDARSKDVFMDGKRMLGRGQRSFSVFCGAHTISITNRADAHDFEIPCGAELVVGK